LLPSWQSSLCQAVLPEIDLSDEKQIIEQTMADETPADTIISDAQGQPMAFCLTGLVKIYDTAKIIRYLRFNILLLF
jgi:hypothetical protein